MKTFTAENLGNALFRKNYQLRYAYIAGAMYKGIASKELVVAMGKAGMLGYLGTGGMAHDEIDASIRYIQAKLSDDQPYGANLLCNIENPEIEEQTVDLLLRRGVRFAEAAAYMRITPSLARWRLKGIRRTEAGAILRARRVLAKVSRPEVATCFMQPAPQKILSELAAANKLSPEEALLGEQVPMADEVCIEADSGGHTDQGVAFALVPTMLMLRDEMVRKYKYQTPIHVGAAGGIGTPHAAAAAFIMGADFVLTGSINQCTVEAGTSDTTKAILQDINVQDTAYAPAGDMFEIGARVQVVRKGLFFPARANKLYELYQRHNSLEEIEAKTREQIQERYFKRSFQDVWEETRRYYLRSGVKSIQEIESKPKQKMALIFKWYFVHTTRLALSGDEEQRVDYQIHCGPALGAFNQWVKGTSLQSWHDRHVADIGVRIMEGTARLLNDRYHSLPQDEPLFDASATAARSGGVR